MMSESYAGPLKRQRPRQTLTTKDVAALCPDIEFTSLGEQALRGKAQPVEVYEVVA